MILKIKRQDDKQEWWILDQIAKISISKSITIDNIPDTVKKETEHDHVFIIDGLGNGEPNLPKIIYKRLICRKEDNLEFSVVFDTFAFLCNNNGKTIERIVP